MLATVQVATPSNCGKLLKPLVTKLAPSGVSGQGSYLGIVITLEDVTMDNPHPSSYGHAMEKDQRLDGGGFLVYPENLR
jgi:hypothetical protein